MIGPLLVVELSDGAASQRDVAALVQACSQALRPVRCGLHRDAPGQTVAAVAIVSFRVAGKPQAMIEVGRRSQQGGSEWLSEKLLFRPEDASVEQFRSMGLTIAVLYRELLALDEPSEDAGQNARRSVASDAPIGEGSRGAASATDSSSGQIEEDMPRDSRQDLATSEPDVSASPVWLALGGFVGSDPGLGSVRLGGTATATYAPAHPLTISLSGRYLRATVEAVSLGWVTLGVGMGAAVPLASNVAVRGRFELLAERVIGQAREISNGRTATSAFWVEGAGSEVQAVWLADRGWGLSLAFNVQRLARGATVRLYDEEVGTTSPWSYGLGLSLELHPLAPQKSNK